MPDAQTPPPLTPCPPAHRTRARSSSMPTPVRGIVPGTRRRLPFPVRWPGRMEHVLNRAGGPCAEAPVRVLEDCLNGRRTVWDDPFKPGRNGLDGLPQVIEMHSPLAMVILMLGSNDFQSMHPHNARHAAQGISARCRPSAARRSNRACRCRPCWWWRRRRSAPRARWRRSSPAASTSARARSTPTGRSATRWAARCSMPAR